MATATVMNLSRETLSILKNFSSINSNILISPGNRLRTISPAKNVLAEATVEENFDTQVALWDMNKFLGTVSLFKDPVFEFNENHVVITGENGSSVKYFYAEPKLITSVEKEINLPETVIEFDLLESQFSEIQRASSVLGLPDLCVKSDGDKTNLVAMDKQDAGSNSYSIAVGDNSTGADFTMFFKVENLKVLSGDYHVEITERVVSKFTHQTLDLSYCIALESDSTYDG